MRLSIRLLRNTVANYLGTVVTFVVALFLTPFIINTLGDSRYGVWTLAGSVAGYLALLDFGLANALAKYTAEYASRHDDKTVSQMASTLFFAFLGVGLICLLGMVWLSFHFASFFDVPAEYASTSRVVVVILGLNFGIGLPLSIYNALAVGYQRYDLLNASVALSGLLNAGLTVVALLYHWDLIGLAVVACLVTATRALLLRWSLKRWAEPSLSIRPRFVSKPLFKLLLSYSVFMFVMLACRQIEESTGTVIVGRLVGLNDVTPYSVGVKVSSLVRQFAFPVTIALFPAFSELSALADRRRLGVLLAQGLRISALVGMPLAGVTIILARPLISFWIGPGYVASAGVATVMLLKVLVDQQLLAASSLLQGMAKLKLYAGLHVWALLFAAGFSLRFASGWGSIAVAIGSLLAWTSVLVVTVPYTAHLAGVSLGDLLSKALGKPLAATAVVCLGLFGLCRWHDPDTFVLLLLYGAVAGLIYLALVWFYCLTRGERQGIVRSARQILHQLDKSAPPEKAE